MNLAVFSNRNLNPWVNWTTLGPPLLEPLASRANARLIAPPPMAWSNSREWRNVLRECYSADTLFWMQGTGRPETPILVASLLRGLARRSAYVVDAWPYALTKIAALAIPQRLDPCFVAFREGCRDLKRRFPRGRFEWLPFGVDTAVFDSVPGERPIFAYWMGRRYEPFHQALIHYCSERGLVYGYHRSGEYTREELGRVVGSSKYFVVMPPNFASPERAGGYSPFVMRYLEGLSSGARLLGTLPGSGEYDALLPRDAILEVAPDGSDLARKLDADRQNPDSFAAVERARAHVRENHSWRKRAEQIFDRLEIGTPTAFCQR